MTLTARLVPIYNGPPPVPAAALIERYAVEGLALRVDVYTADRYRSWLADVLLMCGEAGLLTAPTSTAAAAFRSTGRVQDRWKAARIAAVLDDFRAWAVTH